MAAEGKLKNKIFWHKTELQLLNNKLDILSRFFSSLPSPQWTCIQNKPTGTQWDPCKLHYVTTRVSFVYILLQTKPTAVCYFVSLMSFMLTDRLSMLFRGSIRLTNINVKPHGYYSLLSSLIGGWFKKPPCDRFGCSQIAVVADSVKLGETQTRNKDCLFVYHEANTFQRLRLASHSPTTTY